MGWKAEAPDFLTGGCVTRCIFDDSCPRRKYSGRGSGHPAKTRNLGEDMACKDIIYSVTDSGCWKCTSHKSELYGYPVIQRNNKILRISRYMYQVKYGLIKKGLLACHRCDNRWCINPDHIFIGTHQDNYDDALSKGRIIQNRKLSVDQAKEAVRSTESARVIAKRFNIAPNVIWRIRNGSAYQSVV